MAYATISDYELRNGSVEEGRLPTVEVLLEDAATMLDGLVEVDPEDERQAKVLRKVSCNMVSRCMQAADAELVGVDQMSYTMGPFGQTAHFTNATGDMYLTAAERRMLGLDRMVIGCIPAEVRAC